MRSILAIVFTLLGVSTAAAQRGTVPGDTVSIIVHHVRPNHRAAYDTLMQEVWWQVAQAAGKKYPSYGKQLETRRRYVPIEMGSDSTYTYVDLYFGRADLPKSSQGGNNVFAAAGRSKAQSDAFGKTLRSYLAGFSSGPLIDEAYR
jgi:hypothetical protein